MSSSRDYGPASLHCGLNLSQHLQILFTLLPSRSTILFLIRNTVLRKKKKEFLMWRCKIPNLAGTLHQSTVYQVINGTLCPCWYQLPPQNDSGTLWLPFSLRGTRVWLAPVQGSDSSLSQVSNVNATNNVSATDSIRALMVPHSEGSPFLHCLTAAMAARRAMHFIINSSEEYGNWVN